MPGAAIPQVFEGTPLHSDDFIYTYNVTAGQTVAVGNVVQLASAYTVQAGSANTQFFFGVALTAGTLGPIAIVHRGIVDVVVDGNTTAGQFLVPSTTAGQVHPVTFLSAFSNGSPIRAIALSAGTAQGQVIQALVW